MDMRKTMGSLALLSALLLGSCAPKQAAVQPANENRPVPVQIAEAAPGTIQTEEGIVAKLAPSEEVQVAPKINAKITSLNVKLGQYVKQGQVLFTLDQTDLRNSVNQAEAAYQLALANARQGETNTAQSVAQAENNLKQAQQSLADAQRNAQRMQQLFDQGAIPAQQLEQAKLQLTNAETAYANAKRSLETAQKLSSAGVSQASVNQARVSLDNARQQLANATVRAPISGFVAQVNGAVGEMAGPQMPVVVLVDLNPMVAKAYLSEDEVTLVRRGTRAAVSVEALGKSWQASVTAVSPVMDPQMKAYPVELEIPNPTGELKADMVATVDFDGANRSGRVLVVPQQAVFDQGGKRYVYKVENGTARLVEVVTGAESSEKVEVKKGLAAGDKVVVRGLALLKDGAKVTIQTVNGAN